MGGARMPAPEARADVTLRVKGTPVPSSVLCGLIRRFQVQIGDVDVAFPFRAEAFFGCTRCNAGHEMVLGILLTTHLP